MATGRVYPSSSKTDQQAPHLTVVLFGSSSAVQFGDENILLLQEHPTPHSADFSQVGPKHRMISNRNVSVINILSLQETELYLDSLDQVTAGLVENKEIHAFVFVLQLRRLTDTDKVALEWLQERFGKDVLPFVMILFTYESKEESDTIIDDLKTNSVLEQLLDKCGGRYYTCSKSMNNQSEMRTLLEKIDQLVSDNGQRCYTAEMYQTALKHRPDQKDIHSEQSVTGLNLILLGKKGAGKSATGNTIVGQEAFSLKEISRTIQKESVMIDGVNLDVYDIQGEYDSGHNMEDLTIDKVLSQFNESVPTVFLLVMKSEIVAKDEKRKDEISDDSRKFERTIELIDNLPNWLRQNTWILFTRGDELKTTHLTIEKVIEQTTELKSIIQKLQNRYHVFNNKAINNPDQVIQLIKKIKETPLKMPPKIPYFPRTIQPDDDPLARRIVLLGKTGAGKSATANTILGEKRFISKLCPSSVTKESEMEQAVVAGRNMTIVDTPGLFDTSMSAEALAVEIGRCIYLSSPGPHAFLYVLQINLRFTEQEEEVVHKFEMMFGLEMRKYTIILLTQGDQLEEESPDSLIKENKSLCRLVEQCGGFHVFNNKDLSNRDQVTELMEKIDRMVEKNGGSCYSNKMFEDAARIKQEEEERRRIEQEARQQREEQERENEKERKRKEVEEDAIKVKEMEEKVKLQEQKLEQEKLGEEKKKKQEERPGFKEFSKKHRNHLLATGLIASCRNICIGAAVGALTGIIGGPTGVLVGAGRGAALGAGVGFKVSLFLNLRNSLTRITNLFQNKFNESSK